MKNTIASIALLLAMVANAGPFGYEMGQKIEGEPDGYATDSGVGFKYMVNPPAPFESVVAFHTEEAGVCGVRGNIDIVNFHNDSGGAKHRERADWLAVEIAAKYGEPTLFKDELDDDAFWSKPYFWLEGVKANERNYYYGWEGDLPDDIWAIEVGVEYGSVFLLYHFANIGQCLTQLRDSL